MKPSAEDLARLVHLEARLIDERRFDEWYALYADDAYDWVPLVPGQVDGERHISMMHEDTRCCSSRRRTTDS